MCPLFQEGNSEQRPQLLCQSIANRTSTRSLQGSPERARGDFMRFFTLKSFFCGDVDCCEKNSHRKDAIIFLSKKVRHSLRAVMMFEKSSWKIQPLLMVCIYQDFSNGEFSMGLGLAVSFREGNHASCHAMSFHVLQPSTPWGYENRKVRMASMSPPSSPKHNRSRRGGLGVVEFSLGDWWLSSFFPWVARVYI